MATLFQELTGIMNNINTPDYPDSKLTAKWLRYSKSWQELWINTPDYPDSKLTPKWLRYSKIWQELWINTPDYPDSKLTPEWLHTLTLPHLYALSASAASPPTQGYRQRSFPLTKRALSRISPSLSIASSELPNRPHSSPVLDTSRWRRNMSIPVNFPTFPNTTKAILTWNIHKNKNKIKMEKRMTNYGHSHNCEWPYFLWEVMHNVQQQLNNMMSVMSPTPASWGKPTYTQ